MLPKTLREQQFTLTRHLRDPGRYPAPPGIEERRVRIYRELFFNNIESLLAAGFPVIHETLGLMKWKSLVRQFFASHRSQTPLFTQVASEFVAYIEEKSGAVDLPPWLSELAHYEWIEQSLFISDAQPPAYDRDGNLEDGIPILSPVALPFMYRWPVQEICPTNAPNTPPAEPTMLLVYRDGNNQVRFARLAPFAFYLLKSLETVNRTGHEHLAVLAAEAGADPIELYPHGLQLLQQLHEQGIVLGTLRGTAV